MTVKDMEKLDDMGIQAWDAHDADAFVALLADRFEWQDDTQQDVMRTRDQALEHVQRWFTAFPDMKVKTLNRVVTANSVGAEVEFTGTNSGTMEMGGQRIPPTNKRITAHGTYFVKAKDGKITELHMHPNVAEMMGQLGLLPQ